MGESQATVASTIRPDEFNVRVADSWLSALPHDGEKLLLSDDDRQALSRIAVPVSLPAADMPIYHERDAAQDVFLLMSGLVRTARTLASGRRQIIAFHWPGDVFGLSEHGAYVSDAETVAPTRLARLPMRYLDGAFLQHPALQGLFLVKTLNDLRETQHELVTKSQSDLPTRLAFFLLQCVEHPECYDAATQVVSLPIARADLADYLAAAPESVSRAFAQLEQRRLIRRISPQKIALDMTRIAPFCTLADR